MVADDNSSDRTVALVEKMADEYPCIQVKARKSNVGVAANRDLAIRSMDVDYLTMLDGDDLFLPYKIERELIALNGSTTKVAFSDTVIITTDGARVQSTAQYAGQSKSNMMEYITSRSVPVPRDMLFSKPLFEAAGPPGGPRRAVRLGPGPHRRGDEYLE